MTKIPTEIPDDIKKTANALKKLRPAYATIIGFYEKIFEAQEKSAAETKVNPPRISNDILSIKLKEKFPLISLSEFSVDINASRKLLKEICKIINKSGTRMSSDAETILAADENKKLDFKELYAALLNDDDASFGNIASKLKTPKDVLAFITYNSIKPSVSLYAQSVSKYLDKDNPWEKGYCPVCGNLPIISTFESD
ncbi:MAG: hypothetical protein Q8M86_12935, partial [Syntrophales bacterium]|nr:hypothetical protein [Syntrophales bacterium]